MHMPVWQVAEISPYGAGDIGRCHVKRKISFLKIISGYWIVLLGLASSTQPKPKIVGIFGCKCLTIV